MTGPKLQYWDKVHKPGTVRGELNYRDFTSAVLPERMCEVQVSSSCSIQTGIQQFRPVSLWI